jgi:hypothetical protein
MKKLLLSAFFITELAAFSQISITSTNMPVSGDTIRVTDVNLTTIDDYTSTGANYTWSFDSVKALGQTLREFKSPAAAGYVFGISSQDYGEKTADSLSVPTGSSTMVLTDFYDFYRKNGTSSFNLDAFGFKYSGFGIPNIYSDKDEIYTFPLDYGDRDSTTFRVSTFTTTSIPFSYKKVGYRITEADGWGTVTTPYGQAQCLRVITTQYSTDSISMVLPIPGFTVPIVIPVPNYQRDIQWLTLTERIPFMEVSGTVIKFGAIETFVPASARYRDIKRDFVGVKEESAQLSVSIYPNPAINELNIKLPGNKECSLHIYSITGQLILQKNLYSNELENKQTIDVSGLAPGVYLGKITDGKTVQNFKFNKQ